MKTLTKLSKSLLLGIVLFVAVIAAKAQDAPALSISGSIDTYYRANLNAANKPIGFDSLGMSDVAAAAPTSSFANQSGFSIGMANIIASLEGEKTGFVADLVFGPRGTDAVFGSTTASSSIVNQLYAYWTVSDKLTLTMGNFNTFLGYEVISPTANYNYSTSYMFSYGPFSHSGLKADIALGDASLMLGVFNTTDDTDFNDDGDYYVGAQLGIGGAYINVLATDGFFQGDLTAGWDLSDALYLGVNATYATDNFYGGALYLQNSFSDNFSVGVRGEYFSDQGVGALSYTDYDGGIDAVSGEYGSFDAGSVIDLTLSANYTIGSLTLIPEIRLDNFDTKVVVPEAGAAPQSSLASFVLAAVYSF